MDNWKVWSAFQLLPSAALLDRPVSVIYGSLEWDFVDAVKMPLTVIFWTSAKRFFFQSLSETQDQCHTCLEMSTESLKNMSPWADQSLGQMRHQDPFMTDQKYLSAARGRSEASALFIRGCWFWERHVRIPVKISFVGPSETASLLECVRDGKPGRMCQRRQAW